MASHTVMPKKLAQALMEAGMQHFEGGGEATGGGGMLGGFGQMFSGDVGGGLASMMGYNQFQAHAPPIHQQNFVNSIEQSRRLQGDITGQQLGDVNAYQQMANGQGPNVAQSQLNQNTANNVLQQGALMASQRGANSNPMLMARQAAMQGAGAQQQSVGQAATLQAQQQLAAQQAHASTLQNMYQNQLGAEGIEQGGQAAQNTAITQGSLGAMNINANTSGQNAQRSGNIMGSIMNGAGSMMGGAGGGEVPGGGNNYSAPSASLPSLQSYSKADSDSESQSSSGGSSGGEKKGGGGIGGIFSSLGSMLADGGQIPDHMSNYSAPAVEEPGLKPYTAFDTDDDPSKKQGGGGGGSGGMMKMIPMLAALAKGGDVHTLSHYLSMLAGGGVPGKAEVNGNSLQNDKVPAMLSPGEIVLPRSVTQHPDMEKKAVEFLRHLKSNKRGYGKVIESRKMACGGKVGK